MHCSASFGTDFRLYPNFGKPNQVVAGIGMNKYDNNSNTNNITVCVYVCTRKLVGETRTFSWIAAALDYFGNYTLTCCAHMHVQLSSSATPFKFKQQQQVERESRRLFLNSRFLRCCCCCIQLQRTVFSLCCRQ